MLTTFKGLKGELLSLISMPGKLVNTWLHTIAKIQYSLWRSKVYLMDLLEFFEGAKEHMENGNSINRLYLAFQKAFDEVLTEYF